MAFWFTKPETAHNGSKTAASSVLAGAPTRTALRNKALLARLGCAACPLNTIDITTPKMQPTLVPGAPVLVLAEAPGKHEDETSGEPLTGPSGRLLRECVPKGAEFSADNVVNCRPPENRDPAWQEVECCRPRRIKWIEQAKPKLILGLGKVPLKFMLDSVDLLGMRGRIFAVKVGNHNCWFLPTYHPSYILRQAYDRNNPFAGKFGHCFRSDVSRAFGLALSLRRPEMAAGGDLHHDLHCYAGGSGTDFAGLAQHLKQAAKVPLKAIDIETKGLRPYAKDAAIMSVAISFGDTHFAFAVDHPQAKWTTLEKQLILSTLETILKNDTTKIAHNVPFELEWFIWLYGKNVVNHAAWECTQVQAHILDERRGKSHGGDDTHRAAYQSLDFLTKQHFGITYKSQFKLDKRDMSKTDLTQLLDYNASDTRWTLRLYHHQTRLLKQQGLHEAYLEALPRQASAALMQALGVYVDQVAVKRIQKQLEAEIETIHFNINNLDVVKQYVRDKGSFNPASGPDCISIFGDKKYLDRKEIHISKEGYVAQDDKKGAAEKRAFSKDREDRVSVDKNVLSQIDHDLARLVMELRNKAKLKSTYCDQFELGKGEYVYPDGKIHCNFNTTFAETGRTSSDSPNMQNAPQRRDAWVRKQVVADPGHVLVAFDYGQLEGCTAAICSQDKALVKALWEDYDIHMDFTHKVSKVWAEITPDDKGRSLIKNKFVFPAIFGAQASSIAGYLGIPEEIVEDLLDALWEKYSGLKAWQDKTMKTFHKIGYVESPTGRRHNYPLTRNQVINFPIQSVACDIVCSAMNELSYQARQTGKWHLHPRLNVHDDLTFSIPDNDEILDEAVQQIYKTMLSPPYDFVNVPLSVSVSIGKNWYEMKKIDKFWSHKDL